jgi:sec-independent protein translocase protein TatB
VFGVSFLEIALVGLVALIVVGPQKLPEMMRTAGEWVGKLRRITADMRAQTGIDDILREEGIDGVRELRTLLRGERGAFARQALRNNYEAEISPPDLAVEFPMEGPDSLGALPDDLLQEDTTSPPPAPSPIEEPPSALVSPPIAPPLQSKAPPRKSNAPPPPSSAPPRPTSTKPPRSLPPPPTTPRLSPPRAVTHPETPVSKSELRVTVSEPPPRRSPKTPDKDG